MLQEVADESENQGLKMNKSNRKVMMENDTPNMSATLRSRTLKTTSTWDRATEAEKKTRQGDSKKNHGRMDGIRQSPRHLQG